MRPSVSRVATATRAPAGRPLDRRARPDSISGRDRPERGVGDRREPERAIAAQARTVGPSNASPANRRWNSDVSSSSASMNLTCARLSSLGAGLTTRPSRVARRAARLPGARRSSPAPAHQREPVGPGRSDDGLDHGGPKLRRGVSATTPPPPPPGRSGGLPSRRVRARAEARLVAVAPAQAAAVPGGDAAVAPRRPCSTWGGRDRFGPSAVRRAARRTTSSRRSPVAVADHGARAAGRLGLPRPHPEIAYVQGDACALPFATPRSTSSSRTP